MFQKFQNININNIKGMRDMLINCIKFDYIDNIFTLFVSTKTYFVFNKLTKLTHTGVTVAIKVVVVTAIVAKALTAIDKQKSYFLGEMMCYVYA